MTATTHDVPRALPEEDTERGALDRYFARHALERAAQDPYFMGAALAAWMHRYGLTVDDLAAHLGCPLRELPRLVWYRRPDPGLPRYREMLARIHAHTGADPRRLVALLAES